MTPKAEALAYFIRAYAQPLEWNVTATEVGEAVRAHPTVVGKICAEKGWRLKGIGYLPKSYGIAGGTGFDSYQYIADREFIARLSDEAPEQ